MDETQQYGYVSPVIIVAKEGGLGALLVVYGPDEKNHGRKKFVKVFLHAPFIDEKVVNFRIREDALGKAVGYSVRSL